MSRSLKLNGHLFFLVIVLSAESNELSQPSPVSFSKSFCENDISILYESRTCLSPAESRLQHSSDYGSLEAFDIKHLQLGAEVRGINLSEPVSREQFSKIREYVHKYKFLIFKDQGVITAARQVEISQWFGVLMCILCKHEQSPHPLILRMSNDAKVGLQNVGIKGWHIDGPYLVKPHRYSLLHVIKVSKRGNTVYVDLKEVIDSLSTETRQRWDRLWVFFKHWRPAVYHPLVYTHPVSRQPTLIFHLGNLHSFVWDYGTDKERMTNETETELIKDEIHREIIKDDQRLVYSHEWEAGDFIISDNLAIGHRATPETQLPVSEVGLRILHRTTVRGIHVPQK